MNIEELNSVKNAITHLRALNSNELLETLIASQEPESKIDVLAVKEIPYYFNRMLNQLEIEVEKPNFAFYPDKQNADNEVSSLAQDLSELRDYLNQKNISKIVILIKRLVFYQINNGFWNEGLSVKKDDLISEEISRLKSESEVLFRLSEQRYSESNILLKELNARTEELKQIQIAVQEVDNTSKQAIRYEEQIKAALTQSKEKQSEIEGIIGQLTILNNEMLVARTEAKKEFDEFKTQINKNRENFKLLYDDVESKKSYFDERNQLLTDLIGREVSVSLSNSFETRVTNLGLSVDGWKKWIISVSIFNFIIIVLFYYYNPPIDIWQRIIASALKAIPSLFLLYYTISQYNKERNFQEIYAFKSAVALTIMAYRDQLINPDKKEEFIMNSVKNIYTPPDISLSNSDTKEVNSILDMLKSIKDLLAEKAKKVVY